MNTILYLVIEMLSKIYSLLRIKIPIKVCKTLAIPYYCINDTKYEKVEPLLEAGISTHLMFFIFHDQCFLFGFGSKGIQVN